MDQGSRRKQSGEISEIGLKIKQVDTYLFYIGGCRIVSIDNEHGNNNEGTCGLRSAAVAVHGGVWRKGNSFDLSKVCHLNCRERQQAQFM